MKRLLRWILGPSEKETDAIFEELLREGYIELIGFDHGDPIYKTTKKGRKFLEEYKRRRA